MSEAQKNNARSMVETVQTPTVVAQPTVVQDKRLACNIPSDVLNPIFSLCTPNAPLDKPDSNHVRAHLLRIRLREWVNMTHVCRDWRSKALDCPQLWSSPDFALPALAQEMISRSKSVPLRIDLDLDDLSPGGRAALSDAMKHDAGIRSLHVKATSSRWREMPANVSAMLTEEAPVLCSLSLVVRRGFYSDLRDLPRPFLGESVAPQLQKLVLSGFSDAMLSVLPLLQNLAILEITGGEEPRGIKMRYLLEKLKGMPTLEELVLWKCLPSVPESSITFDTIIHFPKLRRLRLASTLHTCITILNNIAFPGDIAEVVVDCNYTTACDQAQTLDAFTSWFATLFQGAFAGKIIKYLALSDEPSKDKTNIAALLASSLFNFNFRASADVDAKKILSSYGPCSQYTVPTPFLDIHVVWELDFNTSHLSAALTAVINLLRASPLQRLQAILLNTTHWNIFIPDLVTLLFGGCPQLQSALLADDSVNDFVTALHDNIDAFPALKGLYIESPKRLDVSKLNAYLKRRSATARMERLVLNDCIGFVDLNDYNYIRELVADLVWVTDDDFDEHEYEYEPNVYDSDE
ncbi:hypothetical protein VNI00_004831 [Paramarasmius palmivorus]|uniref:F-box domain-containing protein n=1 Tax=Paramarasmius palmivorus TaxID=297713 RepID=A0AAW0DIY9_9AGAR